MDSTFVPKKLFKKATTYLSCNGSNDTFLTEHNFGCDFGDCAGNGLTGAPVIGHFEFDRVTYFQMLNVSIKLGEMEEKSSLAIAALNKSIWVLKKQIYRVSFEEKKIDFLILFW